METTSTDRVAARFAPLRASIALHSELNDERGFGKYVGRISSLGFMRVETTDEAREVVASLETHLEPLRGSIYFYGRLAADYLEDARDHFTTNHADLLGQ